ncbi:MAG: hypothetical protein R2752_13300 [Vicinamibacterales bacterium]
MTNKTRILSGTLIVLLAGGAASMGGVRAQRPEPSASPAPTGSPIVHRATQTAAADDREATACREMAAAVQASDVRLESLAAKLNAATGDARVPIMAELLVALVEDRLLMPHPMRSWDVEPGSTTDHHMTTPSRAQGAGLVASGQMKHLMDSMASAMGGQPIDMMQMMSRCSSLIRREGGERR